MGRAWWCAGRRAVWRPLLGLAWLVFRWLPLPGVRLRWELVPSPRGSCRAARGSVVGYACVAGGWRASCVLASQYEARPWWPVPSLRVCFGRKGFGAWKASGLALVSAVREWSSADVLYPVLTRGAVRVVVSVLCLLDVVVLLVVSALG